MKIGDTDLTPYLIHTNEELPLDLVEQLGLDGSGIDGNERFPYQWSTLTDQERSLLLSRTTGPVTTTSGEHTTVAPVADAAGALADVLYRIEREWEATIEQTDDPDQQDAVRSVLEQQYPLGKDLLEVGAAARAWAEHLASFDGTRISVVSLVAAEILDDVSELALDMQRRDKDRGVDEHMRVLVNNGLGGICGMVAGIFTPTVLVALSRLLKEIHHGSGHVTETAAEFARAYRDSRRQSRTY